MDKDNDRYKDLLDYDEYDHLYKCSECDKDSWRLLVNGTVICTSCYMEYDICDFNVEEGE